MDPFIGEIRLFALSYPPEHWSRCDGQTLPIRQNVALYALLGARYGGDGRETFALPDLRGRAPIHRGSGPDVMPQRLAAQVSFRSADGAENPAVDTLTMNFCIATWGVFPSRP